MTAPSEGTRVDVEARKIPADAPERVYLNLCEETDCEEPFWEHHRHGDGILWTADTPALLYAVGYVRADTQAALCARVRELEALVAGAADEFADARLAFDRTDSRHARVVEWSRKLRAALAPSQPEAANG
jgi:hypothetical protein